MEKSLRILHLEDNPTDAKLSEWALLEESIEAEPRVVSTREEFVAALGHPDFDLILSDYRLPTFNGLEALALARQHCPQIPFIFVTGSMGEDLAIESLKSGATDYVLKQKLSRLAPAVRRAMSEAQERLERAQAEATSRHSDRRFRTLFEQFPFSLQLLATDGHTLRVNQAWEQLWGIGFEDLAGYNILQDQQLADKGVLSYIEKAFAGEASAIPDICYEPAETLPHVAGQARWVEAFICPVKDETGGVSEVVLIHRDVTDERRTAVALRQTEDRLRALAEANLIGIIFSDADGNIVDANDAFLKMVGYSRAELQAGRVRWTELTPPELLYLDERGIAEAKIKGSCTPYEKEYIRKDGSRVPILIGYVLTGDKDHVAFILDLTDLKRAHTALREHSETLAAINRVGQEVAAELDLQKLVQTVTNAATEISGAEFGAFFYNRVTESGESYMIYALSGVPRAAFDNFPMPRNTQIFGPTFRGEGTVRLDDVTQDPRYGKNSPYAGLPAGHLPVRSHLAVPVISRSGEVLGGLFFGHAQAGVFSERAERAVESLAAQTAIAMDNARLFQAIQLEQVQARDSEQRYRFLAESIPQMVWTALPDGSQDYFNQRWVDYTGLSLEQSQGQGWAAAAHSDDVPHYLEAWQHARATGQTFQIEYRLKRAADGAYRWHLGRAEPLRDDQGAVVKWFGTYTDIDDRKRHEETMHFLAEATTLLASSLDYELTLQRVAQLAVPSMADWCLVDFLEEGKLRRVAIAHQDPEQIAIAEKLQHQYPPRDDLPFGAEHVARTGQSELISDITTTLIQTVAHDQEHLSVLQEAGFKSYMCVPLVARGQVLGVMTFITTESKRAYQPQDLALAEELARSAAQAGDNALLYRATQQARQVAEDASRAKDEFLATLSHELRTPLNAMLGWISLLRTGRLDAATAAQALETVERNTRVQTQLVEDILDVSRIITGKLRLESRPVSLVAVIEAALNAVRPAAEAKGISLRARLDYSLGPVAGDPHRLQQVVWNLLSNGIKFTPRGGSVEVRLERLESHLTIIVSDTGMGISAEFQPHVFDRFRQADSSSTREYGGLGLGLAIVRHLVELHGGWVEVTSPGAGEGATFTVHLPLMAVHPTEFPTPPATQLPAADLAPSDLPPPFQCPPALEGLRVLVVDDENDARQLVTHVLEQCNATVHAVATVAAALEVLPHFKPDVLVSDIGMPNEDGYSLIRKIRALSPEAGGRVPAAALTAYARAEDRTHALAAGYQMHLPKPVEPGELALVVASLVGRSG